MPSCGRARAWPGRPRVSAPRAQPVGAMESPCPARSAPWTRFALVPLKVTPTRASLACGLTNLVRPFEATCPAAESVPRPEGLVRALRPTRTSRPHPQPQPATTSCTSHRDGALLMSLFQQTMGTGTIINKTT